MPRVRNELSWRPGYSLTRKPEKKATRRLRQNGTHVNRDGTREFKFIDETITENGPSASLNCGDTPKRGDASLTAKLSPFSSPDQRASAGSPRIAHGRRRSVSHSRANTQLSVVLYNDWLHQYEPILVRYNEEFCKIPLTTDIRVNPFHYEKTDQREPAFLVHAAMALAGHHVESSSTHDHRHASLQALRKSINDGNLNQAQHMLDAIILLFSLDETQSAFGTWGTHLSGAYALLENCHSIKQWQTSKRLLVQVGMLTWWDAILNLVNREDCIFPISYFERILAVYDEIEWDYFGLCGCPLPLVKDVMRLARLGASKRKFSSEQSPQFDESMILEIQRSLESWQYVSRITTNDEESMQGDQDRMHCSEAWRNGLLLYIYRVFHWRAGDKTPLQVLFRARAIADRVFASREDNMITRQALLPLFFAGCELRDASTRRKIIQHCKMWEDKTRYHMFNTTVPLLQQIWAEQEENGFENVWWGQVVDSQQTAGPEGLLQRRLCFG